MVTVPAHSLLAPVRARVIAAARVMPGVCGVLESSCPARTIFTPCSRQSIFETLSAMIHYFEYWLRRARWNPAHYFRELFKIDSKRHLRTLFLCSKTEICHCL